MQLTLVLVIYNQKIEDSPSFQSIRNYLKGNFDVIIYDNSQVPQILDKEQYNFPIDYVHDYRNLGIANAYQYALDKTSNAWLVLLDQDTNLTSDYFNELNDSLLKLDEETVVAVPKVFADGKIVSPASNIKYTLESNQLVEGKQVESVTGINSGACFRVSWLKANGGFNQKFPLDYLDHWLFFSVYQSGHFVYLMNVVIEHDLSVMDYNSISLDRYISISESENLYYRSYQKKQYKNYRKHLKLRVLKQLVFVKNKRIMKQTLKLILKK